MSRLVRRRPTHKMIKHYEHRIHENLPGSKGAMMEIRGGNLQANDPENHNSLPRRVFFSIHRRLLVFMSVNLDDPPPDFFTRAIPLANQHVSPMTDILHDPEVETVQS